MSPSHPPRMLQRVVLFADLRGSTSLFEGLGNAPATKLVTQAVGLMGQVVAAQGGRVVKTLGDGLMAVFEQAGAAARAAQDMHDGLDRFALKTAQSQRGEAAHSALALRLQVGMAHGEVVEIGDDFFGDAVNVASRLLEHAGDNETLLTAAVVDQLSPPERASMRSLDLLRLRGRAEPVPIYLMESSAPSDVATTTYGDRAPNTQPEGIALTWRDTHRIFSARHLPVVLGRNPDLLFCLPDSRISRNHARLEWDGTSFVLTDLSYNGTFVRFDHGGSEAQVLSLRRSSCSLHGRGWIGLAASPQDALAPVVEFEVMSFADTQPQAEP